MSERPRKLLDQVADAIRCRHYSYRTEQTYVQWIKRCILFHQKRHPAEMNTPEIEAFLTDLAKPVGPHTLRHCFVTCSTNLRHVRIPPACQDCAVADAVQSRSATSSVRTT